MKWTRLFLLLFLIPTLIYGLDKKECTKIHNQAMDEWKRHNELIQDSKKESQKEVCVRHLTESLECCRRALGHCDRILHNIAKKSKAKRDETWCFNMKNMCEQDKHTLTLEINQ